jgi:hypothetical protein
MAFSRVRTILACWCSARPSPPRAFIATAGTRTPDGCFSLVPGLWEMSRHLRNYGFVLSTFRNPFGANSGVRSGFPTGRALGLWSPTSTPVPGSGCAPPTRQVVAGSGPACEREARLLASLRPEIRSPREGGLASRSRTESQERPPRRPVRNSPLPPPSPSPRPPVRRWSRWRPGPQMEPTTKPQPGHPLQVKPSMLAHASHRRGLLCHVVVRLCSSFFSGAKLAVRGILDG